MSHLVREYIDDDLDHVVHLWDETARAGQQSVFSVGECLAALREDQPATVAVSEGRIVAAAVSRVDGDRAWILRIAVHPDRRGEGLPSALLVSLERLLAGRRARRIAYVLPSEDRLAEGLENVGYERQSAVAYYEKKESFGPGEASILDALGGQVLPDNLWSELSGMMAEKKLVENRIVGPLAHRELARSHGLEPPRSIILFGPPGTRKTTFARAIASRLGWPFVEIFPSRIASEHGGLLAGIRETFARIDLLERVVEFIDEVEEIAPQRGFLSGSASFQSGHSVVNEMLKVIPSFRARDTRLLVCATNSVRSLDPAFLRPGRFDYVIPVGPPDEAARRAIWSSLVDRSGRKDVDIESLVAQSKDLTPADIALCGQNAAQLAFERELWQGSQPDGPGARSDDYLRMIENARPTVSAAMIEDFTEDITQHARH